MASSILGDGFKTCFSIKSNLIVALAAFWVNFCLLGVLRSNAVIYRALVDVFGVNRKDAAWPSGIFGFFMCVTGALSGFLSHHISIRILAVFGATLASVSVSLCCYVSHMTYIVLFYGAVQGIGVGLIVPLTHVVLNQNFFKYRAVALGVAYSGSSAGSFIFPPIANLLMWHYGLNGTFLLLGGIMLNSLIGAMLFKTPGKLNAIEEESPKELQNLIENYTQVECATKKTEAFSSKSMINVANRANYEEKKTYEIKTTEIDEKRNISDFPEGKENDATENLRFEGKSQSTSTLRLSLEILSSPIFIVVSVAYACYFTTSAVFLIVAVDFARDRRITAEDGVYLVSAFSFGDLCGRLSCGWLTDLQWIKRTTLVRVYLFAMGAFISVLPICSQGIMSAVVVLLGILNGGVIINHSVLLNEYLGLEKLPLAMGFSTCFVGMTAFLRPLIIGFFRDHHQSYNQLFYFLGMLQISITVIWSLEIIVPTVKRYYIFVNKFTQ